MDLFIYCPWLPSHCISAHLNSCDRHYVARKNCIYYPLQKQFANSSVRVLYIYNKDESISKADFKNLLSQIIFIYINTISSISNYKFLLSTFCKTHSLQGSGNTTVKRNKSPCPHRTTILVVIN